MKRFMFLSIGVLCLAIAALIGFYIGSQRVDAQTPAGTVFFVNRDSSTGGGGTSYYNAILPNGDVYYNVDQGGNLNYTAAQYRGNFWGSLVSSDKSTWGAVKENYKK